MLKLTENEIEDILEGDFKRFKVLNKETESSKGMTKTYLVEFLDSETNTKYKINYLHHNDGWYDFYENSQIKIVSTSVLNPPKPIVSNSVKLNEELKKEKTFKEKYYENEKETILLIDKVLSGFPKNILVNKKDELRAGTISDFYDNLYKFCFENKIEANSFLSYVQDTKGFEQLLLSKRILKEFPLISLKDEVYNVKFSKELVFNYVKNKENKYTFKDSDVNCMFFNLDKNQTFGSLEKIIEFTFKNVTNKLKDLIPVTKTDFSKLLNYNLKNIKNIKPENTIKQSQNSLDLN